MTHRSAHNDYPAAIAANGSAAVAAWDDFIAGGSFRASTRSNYRSAALRFLRWLEPQGIGLAQVTPILIERFLDQQDVSSDSKVTYRTGVRRFFDALVARHLVAANPDDQAGRGTDDPLETAPPTLDEMKAAVREVDPTLEDDPEFFDAGVVLLAGLQLGNRKIMPISRFTGVPARRVAEFALRLRANSVWTPEGKTAFETDPREGDGGEFGIELIIHILIATGMMERRDASDPAAPPELAATESSPAG